MGRPEYVEFTLPWLRLFILMATFGVHATRLVLFLLLRLAVLSR